MENDVKMNTMIIQRIIESDIEKFIKSKKAPYILFIWGPRRSGKTTLLNKISKKMKSPIYNFDFIDHRDKFVPYENKLNSLVKKNKIILIDEVQNYPEGTRPLKILADVYKKRVIATGSSELRQKNNEDFDTLTDRYNEVYCLPLSINEAVKNRDNDELLEDAQIYGLYPEIYLKTLSKSEKIKKLKRIVNTYVLKDVVDLYNLKNVKLAKDILTKIALQLGSEVSIREIANSLQANEVTVSNYIEIFIKNYILIPLPSFKTNARRAVSENRKLYFYDLGVRNALVEDFRNIDLRPDAGGLWENLVVIEFEKQRRLNKLFLNYYFYREYGGKEVDFVIEDYMKNYTCVEIKKRRGGIKNIFPIPHKSKVITQENFVEEFSN